MTSHVDAPRGRMARTRLARRLAGPGLALALALVVAACGSGASGNDGVVSLVDPSASPSGSPAASVDPEEAMLAFSKCMREHGVDIQVSSVGEGTASGPGVVVSGNSGTTGPKDDPQTPTKIDTSKMDAANEACKDLLPKGGMAAGPGGPMDAETQDQMLAFAKCMRDHGVDFPDPDFSGGGMSIQIGGPDGGGIDPNSSTFQDAQKACAANMPGGGGLVMPAPAVKP